jgi:nickel-dependent lactate racemase
MKIRLAYGKKGLFFELPDEDYVEVVEPNFVPGLPDERESIRKALREPMASAPLQTLVKSADTITIVFSDLTRPMPNAEVLPVLLEELSHVPHSNIVLINALGTHRPQTKEELMEMLGREVVENYQIIQHDCSDRNSLVYVGKSSFGNPISVNRAYMESSVRILTGLIEPHFFAGFSGGPKAVLPGLAAKETILRNHGAHMIGHPKATWLITEANPIWEEMREAAAMTNPTFLLNVAINPEKKKGAGG